MYKLVDYNDWWLKNKFEYHYNNTVLLYGVDSWNY